MESGQGFVIPRGFRAAGIKAGIKASGSLDLAVVVADRPCSAAGTFTTNRVSAAPVQWDRARVPSRQVRAIVVNSGNANAATGRRGLENAARTATVAALVLGCEPDQVLVASTGVIGHQLPMEKLEPAVRTALGAAASDQAAFDAASRAIMTTDTRPKTVSLKRTLGGSDVSLFGMAKGAAMIGPRMATMLGFLMTDAKVAPDDLQKILSEAVEESFNCISVEGHTSTNDSVLLLANGAAGEGSIGSLSAFAEMVREACISLAKMIPDDGEGARHLITIDVEGCRGREEARSIARAIADSPLVKTAITGADPNWGRIVSAAGYAGIEFQENEVSLWLDDVRLYSQGTPLAFDARAVSERIRNEREVRIRLQLERGSGSVRFWTCDLTAEYIRLNADYTT
jgi:glutamate N-acetyltransferase/amino-acid N-acetyltransferase